MSKTSLSQKELQQARDDARTLRELHDRVDELVGSLTKPLFVWRMANGTSSTVPGVLKNSMQRSAETRRINAELEIEQIVASWVAHHFNVDM